MTNKTRARVFSVFQRARRMVLAKLAPAARKRNDSADDRTDSDSDSDDDDSAAGREWGIVHAPHQDEQSTRSRTDHLSLTTTHGGVQVTLVISASAQRRASPDLHLQRTQAQWIFAAAADGQTPTRRLFQKPMYAVAFVSASHFSAYVERQLEVASRRHAERLAGSSVPLTPRSLVALPTVGYAWYRAAPAGKPRMASTHSIVAQLSMHAIAISASTSIQKQTPRPTKAIVAAISASAAVAHTPAAHFRRGVPTAKQQGPNAMKTTDTAVSVSTASAHASAGRVDVHRDCLSHYMDYEVSAAYMAKRKLNEKRLFSCAIRMNCTCPCPSDVLHLGLTKITCVARPGVLVSPSGEQSVDLSSV